LKYIVEQFKAFGTFYASACSLPITGRLYFHKFFGVRTKVPVIRPPLQALLVLWESENLWDPYAYYSLASKVIIRKSIKKVI